MEDLRIEDAEIENTDPPWFRLRAVAVHLYTASGAVLALLILIAAFQGEAVKALWLMLASLIIDSTDGLLARRLRVSEALPFFDGALLENIVDYMTYVFAPMVLLWSGGYLPKGNAGVVFAALPLLASSYQFCRVDAKTDDHFFLGFPSYFNVVAFYAIVFEQGPGTLAAVLVVCSLLVFVPIRYVYPTRTIGNEDEFVERWKQAAHYLRQREGFVSTRLHQSLNPHAPFRFINVAVWESAEHFQQAMSTPEFHELAGEMPFSSHPALYRVISE